MGPSRHKRKAYRGIKAKGKTFEKQVGRELKKLIKEEIIDGELFSNRWLTFQDRNGHGFAQPDHFVVMKDYVLLVEAKLTEAIDANIQLNELYGPLLGFIYRRPILLLAAFKNPRTKPGAFHVQGPRELVENPRPGIHLWNFLP